MRGSVPGNNQKSHRRGTGELLQPNSTVEHLPKLLRTSIWDRFRRAGVKEPLATSLAVCTMRCSSAELRMRLLIFSPATTRSASSHWLARLIRVVWGNGRSVAFDAVSFDEVDGDARDTLITEAGESEGVYIAEFDLDKIRAYRERESWGNAFRKSRSYGPLASLEVQAPFTRKSPRR